MALTVGRFLAIAVLGCAAVAVVYLPPRGFEEWPWGDVLTPEFLAWRRISNALGSEVHALRLLEKRDSALAALGPHRGTVPMDGEGGDAGNALLYVDPSVPPRLRGAVEEVMTAAADSLLGREARFAAALFLDTATQWNGIRVIPPRRDPDIRYFLPDTIVGTTCLTVVTVGPTHRDHALEADQQVASPVSFGELLGPCRLVVQLGPPGPAMASWIGLGLYEGEAALGARCRDRDERACDHLLFRFLETPPPRIGAERFSVRGGFGGFGRRFTPFDAALLQSVADSVGTTRFKELWHAEHDLAGAFERAAGVPATRWIRDRLTPQDPNAFRQGDRPAQSALLQGLGVVLLSVLVAMGVAARRVTG